MADTTDGLSIPGPWRLDDPINQYLLDDHDGYHIIEGESKTAHLHLTGFIPLDVAHAITAVPELLAAAKRIRAVINDHVSLADVDALDAAIAKAEGRS